MCVAPVVTGMKFYYHYHTELNDSNQQDATESYRNTQTEFTSDIKQNGIKVKDGIKINLIKEKKPDNFYNGLFRIVYMIILNQKYMFRNFCKTGKLNEIEKRNSTLKFARKTHNFIAISNHS